MLKVLFLSAEVAPFSSIGGLSQVSYFLPRALLSLGVDVRIFTPKYGTLDEAKFSTKMVVEGLRVPTGEDSKKNPRELVCNVKTLTSRTKGEPLVYFLENQEYFEKRANVYGYSDDHVRFGLLSRGALEFMRLGDFVPDVVHLNDWHTAYFVNYFEDTLHNKDPFRSVATVLSVHNLFQGIFDYENASEMDFDDGKGELASFYSDRFYKQNGLKRGVMRADVVNTVSETYAAEILSEEYGRGLHNLFAEVRGKVYGVLNGLDYNEFNPGTDKLIKSNFTARNMKNRLEDKADLQRQFGLKVDPAVPILAFWGRLDWQKGVDLIMETIEFVLAETPAQLVIMGKPGDERYREFFGKLGEQFPGQVGTHLTANFALPRKIAAGADMLLMPSRYEPGGIVAMEALRYGCVPIVRATGGLADMVTDFDPEKNTGNGFVFKKFARESFLVAIVRALEAYKNRRRWEAIVKRAMNMDFSWKNVAGKYLDLYKRAIEFRHEMLQPNPSLAIKQNVLG